MTSKLGGNGSAGGLMRIGELNQRACGIVEVCEGPQVFQLFAVSYRGQETELRAAGLQPMRGFGEGPRGLGFHCGANLLHQYVGVVQIRREQVTSEAMPR